MIETIEGEFEKKALIRWDKVRDSQGGKRRGYISFHKSRFYKPNQPKDKSR